MASQQPSGAQIVADALRYVGHPYSFGGWDCSSYVNHVFGQDLGMAIPGYRAGAYKGPPPHGPVVIDWADWSGAATVADPQPGDLAVWRGVGTNGHMGIVVAAGRMISALDPQMGTAVTPIDGFGPGGSNPSAYRRVTGVQAVPGGLMPPGGVPAVVVRVLLLAAGLGVAGVAVTVLVGLAAAAAASAAGVSRRR